MLWRSSPALMGAVTQDSLYSSPEVSTSDHKPVCSAFSMVVEGKEDRQNTDSRFSDCPDIWISDLSGECCVLCAAAAWSAWTAGSSATELCGRA